MIGESSGVTTLINNERINRENQVRPESKAPEQGKDAAAANFSDVTSFSSEALALSKNVAPVSGSAKQQQVEQQSQGQDGSKNTTTARFLDIRV